MPILTNEQVIEIRSRPRPADWFQEQDVFPRWANEFGCSVTTIRNIVDRLSYMRPECFAEGSAEQTKAVRRGEEWRERKREQTKNRYVSATKRKQVIERQGHRCVYRCVYCSGDLRDSPTEIDHIKPVAAGGTNGLSNLQALCQTCNRRKKAFPDEPDLEAYLERRRAYDAKRAEFFAFISRATTCDELEVLVNQYLEQHASTDQPTGYWSLWGGYTDEGVVEFARTLPGFETSLSLNPDYFPEWDPYGEDEDLTS